MRFVSEHLRRQVIDLGRLSKPLGDVEARRFAELAMAALSSRIASGQQADEIIDFYKVQIIERTREKFRSAAMVEDRGKLKKSSIENFLTKFSSDDHFQMR